jgi:septum formation inhibitor MinC
MKLFRLTKITKTKDGKEIKQVMANACDLNTLKLLIESCNDGECTFEQEEVVLAEAPKEKKEEKKPEVKAKSKKEEAEDDEDEEDEESGLMEKIKTGAKYALVGGIGVGAGWLAHSVFGKKKDND